ncbi:MAG: hypothetical protein K6T90_18155 [Leptolyngbyaceae cyanobacterium HOT.MB2.61]|nr:hypothetical protein [Leptolyngbyaceae cyanobacterium HOT.MB2.61]
MMTLEQLTLNGSITLLTYLQCAQLTNDSVNARAVAAALCEMLNQLESIQPGITYDSGWRKVNSLEEDSVKRWESTRVEADSVHRF